MDRLSTGSREVPAPVAEPLQGDAVPVLNREAQRPTLLSAASLKAIRHRMLLIRQSSLDRIAHLSGTSASKVREYRHELLTSDLPETLARRGAGLAFTRELPQAPLLYILCRAFHPDRIVETGVRPGYSTAWLLSALAASGHGELISLGPGPSAGRASGVVDVTVGQFVPPQLRSHWTLVLGNSMERVRDLLEHARPIDLFFYDNGPDPVRARFELRTAWSGLSPRGLLLAHHIDVNPAWAEFCRLQGLGEQVLDPGPPPMGALGMQGRLS